MIPLLLLLPLLFLLAVHGQDSRKEEPRVVVIAIDGLRWQEVFEGARRDSLMPFLWKMGEERGCMMGNRNRKSRMEVENGIWKSYAGYNEMLCGVTDDEHIFDNRKQYNPNRSVLEMVDASPDFRDRVSAQVRRDSVTLHRALKTLGDKHPKLLFVEFCETDYYAHHGKWKEYLDAAHRNDHYIRELWQYCQGDEFYRGNTTFIITCDHGRGTSLGAHANRGEVDPQASWTDHGKKIEGSNQTWLVAFGRNIQHLGEMEGGRIVYTSQVAPTVANILNVPFTVDRQKKMPAPILKILK